MTDSSKLPLDGIRILDFTQADAGPRWHSNAR